MGERGPRPKPTGLRLLHGDKEARINRREPVPDKPSRTPACFPDMTPAAKLVWRRLAPQLWRMNILTDVDRDGFRGYCESIATRDEAAKLLEAGLLITGALGNLVKNPAWQIYRDADAAARRWAHEYGLTPSARSTIKPPEGEEGDLGRLIRGGRG